MRRALILLAALSMTAAAGGQAAPADFPNPPSLQPQVRFWTRIYTEVGTDGGLIHDAYNLDVVYERVDFPDVLSGRDVDSRYESTKEKYRSILRRLAAGERENLGPDELRVLKLWPEGVSNQTLLVAADSVRLQRGQADRFREGLIRSGAWEGYIERTLQQQGLPKELATLPHVESSYNPEAYSKVGAAGLWQFMPSTGRLYMRVDNVVDERMDPYKATEAAGRLLQHNYEMLGAWPLALTAYNHGAGGVARAARDLGTRDIAEIVKRYEGPGFGFASRNFYTSFLAAREASQHAEHYFGPIRKQEPIDYRVVHLDKPFSVKTLESALGVDTETLKIHNLALRDSFWNGRKRAPAGITVRVPKRGASLPVDQVAAARNERWRPKPFEPPPAEPSVTTTPLAMAAAEVGSPTHAPTLEPAPPPVARTGTVLHQLRPGETVASLGRRYGVESSLILAVNNVRNPRSLKPGTRLRIPAKVDSLEEAPVVAVQVEAPVPAAEPAPTPAPEPPAQIAEPEHLGEVVAALAQAEAVEVTSAMATPEPGAAPSESEGPSDEEAPLGASAPGVAKPSGAKVEKAARTSPAADRASDTAELARDTLDRSRYRVGTRNTITLQTDESLAQVASWLGISQERLRSLNKLSRKAKPRPGQKLKLDFAKVSQKRFEQQRLAYHQALRNDFFEAFEVAGTEQRTVRKGDTMTSLVRGKTKVPTWLLKHYNPNIDFRALQPGKRVTIPRIEKKDS
jgi:membrane-bound lytic murein transglycosylase D